MHYTDSHNSSAYNKTGCLTVAWFSQSAYLDYLGSGTLNLSQASSENGTPLQALLSPYGLRVLEDCAFVFIQYLTSICTQSSPVYLVLSHIVGIRRCVPAGTVKKSPVLAPQPLEHPNRQIKLLRRIILDKTKD